MPPTVEQQSMAADASDDLAAELMSLLYTELRAIAGRMLRRESRGHTLQTTALLHEAYLRLAEHEPRQWATREDFFAAGAQAIRRVLIDHARGRRRSKRGRGWQRLSLAGTEPARESDSLDILDLDDALTRLATLSARQARVVELRYFGGLSEEETARVLGVSRRTVQTDWRGARAWLHRELGREGDGASDAEASA
jgi:RNA polymerase sigma-70 factor (ECF subfamily)